MNTTDKTLEMRSQAREKVFRWLEKSVADGTLKPGEAAPSIRDLAERLGIANGTAAAALRDAEARGVVVRRNAGAYKRFIPDHAAEKALATRSIFVICKLGRFASGKPAPRWSDPYMAFELIPRLAAGGRHVMLLNSDEMQKEEVAGVLGTHPAGVLVMGTVIDSPIALEALRVCREAGILRSFTATRRRSKASTASIRTTAPGRGCSRNGFSSTAGAASSRSFRTPRPRIGNWNASKATPRR